MNQSNQSPNAQQKKGLSGVAIALIVVGVLFVLALSAAIVGGIFVGREVKKIGESIKDGGLVVISPPEVVAALGPTGDKKDYVGAWESKKSESSIDIHADGMLAMVIDEGRGSKESYTNVAIAAFHGDDIELHPAISIMIKVNEPPHRVGDHWEMKLRNITFSRPDRPAAAPAVQRDE